MSTVPGGRFPSQDPDAARAQSEEIRRELDREFKAASVARHGRRSWWSRLRRREPAPPHDQG